MKIKKIQAKTFGEALSLVSRELGKDAVILSSKNKKGANAHVEITAAVDYEESKGNNAYYEQISKADNTGGLNDIKKELKDMRDILESMKNSSYEMTLSEDRKEMFSFLKEKSINEELAFRLAKRAKNIEDIKILMTNDIDKSSFTPGNKSQPQEKEITMLIGPSGAGKTTTIAKLAAGAIKKGKKVGLLSLDTYKIGGIEQIRIYSKMMGIPLDVVPNPGLLKKSIDKFSDRDMILIDTTGRNPRDDRYITELKDIYKTGLPIETQLLLSTSNDCNFLTEAYKYYTRLPVDSIAFTKTDEAMELGSIYNLCLTYQKPISYITTGQYVPGNIEFVNSKKLTELVLRTGNA